MKNAFLMILSFFSITAASNSYSAELGEKTELRIYYLVSEGKPESRIKEIIELKNINKDVTVYEGKLGSDLVNITEYESHWEKVLGFSIDDGGCTYYGTSDMRDFNQCIVTVIYKRKPIY